MFTSAAHLQEALAANRYFIDAGTAGRTLAAVQTGRPVLVSGPRGCGKDALAVALAAAQGSHLVRLECRPGAGTREAAYRWDTARQITTIEAGAAAGRDAADIEQEISGAGYLLKGPLLEAITADDAEVTLLVAGLDRADGGLIALLANFLDGFTVEIPLAGSFQPQHPPQVILTAVAEGPAMEAITRQCVRLPVKYPGFADEVRAIDTTVPGIPPGLSTQIRNIVEQLRAAELERPPGVGDAIAWARKLTSLGLAQLDSEAIMATADTVLPLRADRERLGGSALLGMARPHLDRAG